MIPDFVLIFKQIVDFFQKNHCQTPFRFAMIDVYTITGS